MHASLALGNGDWQGAMDNLANVTGLDGLIEKNLLERKVFTILESTIGERIS